MPILPLYGPALRGFLHQPRPLARVLALAALAAPLSACASGEPDGRTLTGNTRTAQPQNTPPSAPARPTPTQRPPALVENVSVSWAELQPLLAEAAGGVVLEEIALDRALADELRSRGLTITDDDVQRERDLLLRTLSRAAGASPDAAAEALASVRRSRGLGEQRFSTLLRRNASLRRLVQPEITLTEDELRQGFAVQYGPRYVTRLIMTPSERAAAQAMSRLRAPQGAAMPETFGEVAAALSTDPSALRGGLIEPISPADPAYPVALRQALPTLQVGAISEPIALDSGYAIIKLEEILPAAGRTFEEVRAEVEAEVRLMRERIAMDTLASRLLAATPVIVFDRNLDWSWQGRREQDRR